MLKHALSDRFVNCERREERGGGGGGGKRFVTVKPCDIGKGNSFLHIKAAVKVIHFIGKSIVGSGSIPWRRLVRISCVSRLQKCLGVYIQKLPRFYVIDVLRTLNA